MSQRCWDLRRGTTALVVALAGCPTALVSLGNRPYKLTRLRLPYSFRSQTLSLTHENLPIVDAVLSSVLDRALTCPCSFQPTLYHPARSCPSRVPTSLVTSPISILAGRLLFAPLQDPCTKPLIRLLRSAVYGAARLSCSSSKLSDQFESHPWYDTGSSVE